MANIDWISIKSEYINTSISQRKLAEKYGISLSAIHKKSKGEKWVELREEQQYKSTTKVIQKTQEEIVNTEVDRIVKIYNTADKLHSKIDESIEQLTIQVDMFGKGHKGDVIDVNRLRKLVASIKELKEIMADDGSEREVSKLDKLIEGITNAAKS